jgi:peptide/nickel transport system ATP-binding protein
MEAARRRSGSNPERAIAAALAEVNLDSAEVLDRNPFELSGGMNQRVAIAMALIQHPEILIADEPTTALDTSTQIGILALLRSIQRSERMALVLISHDLAVVDQLAQRVVVMYAGRVVEVGPTDQVVNRPAHPYTNALLKALPRLSTGQSRLESIPGQLQPTFDHSRGCPFAKRCLHTMDKCLQEFPDRTDLSAEHSVWCWLHQEQESKP